MFAVIDSNGDVISQLTVPNATSPPTLVTLDHDTGAVVRSTPVAPNTASIWLPALDAISADDTIYFRQNGPSNDRRNLIKVGAVRDGVLLWVRHVNEDSGYGGWLTLTDAGELISKVDHGCSRIEANSAADTAPDAPRLRYSAFSRLSK